MEQQFATLAIHEQPMDDITGAVVSPISLATTFKQQSPGILTSTFDYARTDNPTRQQYENLVAKLEGGTYGISFASGCACLSTILLMLDPSDHIICMDEVYGGTQRIIRKVFGKQRCTFVDLNDQEAFLASFNPHTKLVWCETPTNPSLKIVDIASVASTCHQKGALLVVDNTFLSPYFQKPLSLGADLVVHSASKYLNGHSDVINGIAVTNNAPLAQKLKYLQNAIGAIPSPFDCYLLMRGIKTLAIRMEKHQENARIIAEMLESHPQVDRVSYPGLTSHPQYDTVLRQQTGFGGVITFWLKTDFAGTKAFISSLRIFTVAESLGCVESLIDHPASMTHASVAPEERLLLGITDNMIRLSVGIEDIQDLLLDLEGALDKMTYASISPNEHV